MKVEEESIPSFDAGRNVLIRIGDSRRNWMDHKLLFKSRLGNKVECGELKDLYLYLLKLKEPVSKLNQIQKMGKQCLYEVLYDLR